MHLKMTAFWDIAACSLIEVDQRFRDAYCLRHQGDFNNTTRRYISEGYHTRCHENLKSHIMHLLMNIIIVGLYSIISHNAYAKNIRIVGLYRYNLFFYYSVRNRDVICDKDLHNFALRKYMHKPNQCLKSQSKSILTTHSAYDILKTFEIKILK
jgi:hypothetical protein